MVSIPNFTDGAWKIAATANIAGDPNGDILWQNINDQSLLLWQQNGATTTAVTEVPSILNFTADVVGDFDGDGFGDIILEPPSASAATRKMLLSSTGQTVSFAGNNEWNPITASDLTGDGKEDLVRLNELDARFYVAEMDGPVQTTTAFFASGYTTSDSLYSVFDGTATNSFRSLWFDASASQYEIATYTAGVRAVTDTFTVSTGRTFLTDGDFNGDGNQDFVFRDNASFGIGDIEVIFTNNAGLAENRLTYDADLFDRVDFVAGGDFDGDGRSELLSSDSESDELTVYNVIGGDQFAREYFGGNDADLIDGQEGNDTLSGFDGDDILLGGDGRDMLFLGEGNDRGAGGADDDTIYGAQGDDIIKGGSGDDVLEGGLGSDSLEAGNGTDFLIGGEGDDYLLGGSFGFDHMRGGAGNDIIRGGSDRTLIEGGIGDDHIIGSSSNDYIFGDSGDDFLVGGLSQDVIYGGSGNDIIVGVDIAGTSGTDDTVYGGSGSDYFYLGNDDGNYYTGSGELYIMDFSTSVSSGDWLMLNGTLANYDFFDAGASIQVRQSSDNNILAVIETTATASAVAAKAIYIG